MTLSAADWAQIEVLFPQLAALAAGERARFLDRECARAPALRAELEAMLAAAEHADPLLDRPVALASPQHEALAEALPAGARLGSWKIHSLIGRGGMGEVYLAERADGAYTMRAAIKLLKRELFSYANAQRFLRERRVLARLSHPNIARALDAGTTDDGRPYLVMEYVHGARITEHARDGKLGPRAVAQLLLAVAEGVAEAHRHGIVHRDLKPANVLVTPERQVKLLDFGIAKLSDESEAEMPGAVPMTPAYAAPEQIRGQELTPATDVYALGVMLFQLLTGRLPHAREGMPLPIIAAGLSAETLARPEGDLGWVAIRALQPDAAARYASAGEFADDLRRYLDHRPVLARPASPAYRAARFFRRLFALAFPDDRSG